jgi:hypothetical protein
VARADEGRDGDARRAHGGVERVGVHPAEPVHRYRHGRSGGRLVQHGGVLDGRVHHDAAGRPPGRPDAPHGGLHRRGTAGTQPDLVGPHAQLLGERGAGRVEQVAGAAAGGVQLAGVGPAVLGGGLHRLARHGMQWQAGRGVEKPGWGHDTTVSRRTPAPCGRSMVE